MDRTAINEYNAGRRIFNFATWVTKVIVKDKIPKLIKKSK
jgi:hypothetical protein